MNKFMKEAIVEAKVGIKSGDGGPFGCVVVKDGKIVGRGHNCVIANCSATCHGEVMALNDAGKNLGTFNLLGCDIYTTAQPCPMCFFACKWANIEHIYYGCTIADNAQIGFRDEEYFNMLKKSAYASANMQQIDRDECLKVFEEYTKIKSKKP